MALPKGAITLGLAMIWVIMGIICTMWIQGLTFITALYVVVQIVTTIGYGDISVNANMHWFMTFYVILGLCVAANAVDDIVSTILEKGQEKLRVRMCEMRKSVESNDGQANRIQGCHHEVNELIAASGIFLVFVVGGAIFYTFMESCTCSYGVSAKEGCIEDSCLTTDGYQLDFGKSIYMSVITLTTVGFGDFTPKTQVGRLLGVFWMIAGVLAFGNFVTAFSALIAGLKKDRSVKFSRKVFDAIDRDGNGYLTRGEFLCWMLTKEKIVSEDQIDTFYDLFTTLAKRGGETTTDGLLKLSFETLVDAFHETDADGSTSEESEMLNAVN